MKKEMGDMAGKDSEVMVRTKSGALCLRDCIKPTSIQQSAALHLSFSVCVCVCGSSDE